MANSTEIGRYNSVSKAELLRPETYKWKGLRVEARCYSCRCCLLCDAARQPPIHLASRVLFSLAFLYPVLGITSSPEQEGIPVIMCSVKAATGLPKRGMDTVIWPLKAGQEAVFVSGHHSCLCVKDRSRQINIYCYLLVPVGHVPMPNLYQRITNIFLRCS